MTERRTMKFAANVIACLFLLLANPSIASSADTFKVRFDQGGAFETTCHLDAHAQRARYTITIWNARNGFMFQNSGATQVGCPSVTTAHSWLFSVDPENLGGGLAARVVLTHAAIATHEEKTGSTKTPRVLVPTRMDKSASVDMIFRRKKPSSVSIPIWDGMTAVVTMQGAA